MGDIGSAFQKVRDPLIELIGLPMNSSSISFSEWNICIPRYLNVVYCYLSLECGSNSLSGFRIRHRGYIQDLDQFTARPDIFQKSPRRYIRGPREDLASHR